MRIVPLLLAVLVAAAPAAAAGKAITLYLDGARVESEVTATKGYLEVPLPRGMEEGSLRIRPLRGTVLARVETIPARSSRKLEAELSRLAERKDMLGDRLKALDAREEIFRAAAKSQSGKAPRKTKTNREPLEEIRKGTEFAIAQLEGVYRSRRKTEKELKGVEAQIASLREEGNVGGSVARIWVKGKGGRVAVSYLQPALKWTPCYDFRLDTEREVSVTLNALLPEPEKGARYAVVPALLSEAQTGPLPAAVSGGSAQVASFMFPIAHERFYAFPQASLSFSFLNRSGKSLPPGEATCYRQGEYLGKAGFGGCPSGESREVVIGKLPPAARQ